MQGSIMKITVTLQLKWKIINVHDKYRFRLEHSIKFYSNDTVLGMFTF